MVWSKEKNIFTFYNYYNKIEIKFPILSPAKDKLFNIFILWQSDIFPKIRTFAFLNIETWICYSFTDKTSYRRKWKELLEKEELEKKYDFFSKLVEQDIESQFVTVVQNETDIYIVSSATNSQKLGAADWARELALLSRP